MEDCDTVPCLDLTGFDVSHSDEDIEPTHWKGPLKDQLVQALTEVGFLQVTGHGIPQESIQRCFASGQRFFDKSIDYKMQFYRDFTKTRCGYVPMSDSIKETDIVTETFDLNKPPDIKECLDICHSCDNWTDVEFQRHASDLIRFSQRLVSRLLVLLGHGLAPENPDLFQSCFKNFATKQNTSQLRFLRYPSVPNIAADRLRCGEHTDYGCLTLVFMDTCPGLQVFTRCQRYVDVLPVPGAVLVNIGDLMQRWTGDLLRSAKHRVVVRGHMRERHSLVYFSHPDEEEVVSPVIGPNRGYSPVVVRDHMDRRFEDTFRKGKGLDETLTGTY